MDILIFVWYNQSNHKEISNVCKFKPLFGKTTEALHTASLVAGCMGMK